MGLNSRKLPPSNNSDYQHLNIAITAMEYLGDYQLRLTFDNGVTKIVDLEDRLLGRGGLFASLRDKEYFAQVFLNLEVGTIEWPNQLDWAPDVLYQIGKTQ